MQEPLKSQTSSTTAAHVAFTTQPSSLSAQSSGSFPAQQPASVRIQASFSYDALLPSSGALPTSYSVSSPSRVSSENMFDLPPSYHQIAQSALAQPQTPKNNVSAEASQLYPRSAALSPTLRPVVLSDLELALARIQQVKASSNAPRTD